MIRSLLAGWFFDLPRQTGDYNITVDNGRSYQLREVAAANARVQKKRDNQAVTACFLPWGSNRPENCLELSEVYANRVVYKFARV